MAPPDPTDPAQRAAYRAELAGVARGMRRAAVLLACAGAAVALARRSVRAELPLWLPVGVLGLAAMLAISAVAARERYHRLRVQGRAATSPPA